MEYPVTISFEDAQEITLGEIVENVFRAQFLSTWSFCLRQLETNLGGKGNLIDIVQRSRNPVLPNYIRENILQLFSMQLFWLRVFGVLESNYLYSSDRGCLLEKGSPIGLTRNSCNCKICI